MPLEQIKKEIEAKAEDELSQMRKAAYTEAIKVVHDAEAMAKQMAESSVKETDSYISGKRTGMEASAEMEARKIWLEALDEALGMELKRIRKELIARLRQKSYEAIFARASKVAPVLGDHFTVSVNKTDAKLAAATFKHAHVEHSDIEGLMLYSSDGKIIVDMRLETLADSALEGATGTILEALSRERGGAAFGSRSTASSSSVQKKGKRGRKRRASRKSNAKTKHGAIKNKRKARRLGTRAR